MRRLPFVLLVLGWALLAGGCAGLLEFHLPGEFKEGKQKEDPPGSCLPLPRSEMPC
jgi:hypothetical protein